MPTRAQWTDLLDQERYDNARLQRRVEELENENEELKEKLKMGTTLEQMKAQRDELSRRIEKMEEAKRREAGRAFVEKHGITMADVELSDGKGKPWFGDISTFIEWLRDNSTKPFVEWNTQIHHRALLLAGKFDPTPATLDDVKGTP